MPSFCVKLFILVEFELHLKTLKLRQIKRVMKVYILKNNNLIDLH